MKKKMVLTEEVKDRIVIAYLEKKLSVSDIAVFRGIPRETVRATLSERGVVLREVKIPMFNHFRRTGYKKDGQETTNQGAN